MKNNASSNSNSNNNNESSMPRKPLSSHRILNYEISEKVSMQSNLTEIVSDVRMWLVHILSSLFFVLSFSIFQFQQQNDF